MFSRAIRTQMQRQAKGVRTREQRGWFDERMRHAKQWSEDYPQFNVLMASSRSRHKRSPPMRSPFTLHGHIQGFVLGVICATAWYRYQTLSAEDSTVAGNDGRINVMRPRVGRVFSSKPPLFLFISIGSAPANFDLRRAARASWLRWLPDDGSVRYKFFSDERPEVVDPSAISMWESLLGEAKEKGDIVLQPIATGYGSNSENAYGERALFQLEWTLSEVGGLHYYLRIDDDSFLCLHRLLYELKSAPREQFFWGRYWCRSGRSRADENFMLFSGDVVKFLADRDYIGQVVPFDPSVTMGWNFGFMSWFLNLSIFDDQKRLDAQQGYLTDYMHTPQVDSGVSLSGFCDDYMYAHHVKAPVIRAAYDQTTLRSMYSVPLKTSPRETCLDTDLSFIPGRHSDRLPNVNIGVIT